MNVLGTITLDMQRPGYVGIYAVQFDKLTRQITAQLTDKGLPWTVPTGALMTIRYSKPDGTQGFYDTLEDGTTAYTISGSAVTFTLAQQALAAVGNVLMQLNFYTAGGEALSSFSFIVTVQPSVLNDAEVVSSDYYNVLTGLLTQFAEQIEDLDNALRAGYGAPLKAATVSAMTDHAKIYVYTGSETGYTAGHWYYYNGNAWTDGGVYNAVAVNTDTTLTLAGVPADAKATGDAVGELKSDLTVSDEIFAASFDTSAVYPTTFSVSNSINENGELVSIGNWFKHTRLIPVKYGKTYKIKLQTSTPYNLRVHGYTSNATDSTYDQTTWVEQLAVYVLSEGDNTVFVTIDNASISYLRLSGATYTTEILLYGDFFEETVYKYVSDTVNDYVSKKYSSSDLWEQGSYSGSTPTSSTTRLRTIDYFTADTFHAVNILSGYEILIIAWDKTTGSYVGTWGANGTAFVTSGTSTYVTFFNFMNFPDYKFKAVLRNKNDTSATIIVNEGINAVFDKSKFLSDTYKPDSHPGYFRLYSDITSSLIWENKTITTSGISDSSSFSLAELPSSGNVEIRLRRTVENNEFSIWQELNGSYTLLNDWTHYEYRYTGDYEPKYYVCTRTAAGSNAEFIRKHCVVVYKYCDQGKEIFINTKMFGKKVAVFGDSIVQGKVRKNQATDVNSVTCKPWSSLLGEINGDFNPHNFGIGGATVANAGTTTYPDWKSLYTNRNIITDFDIVFICAGINDYGAAITEENFRTAYAAVLDALIENNMDVVVVTNCARSTNTANSAGLRPSDYASLEKEIGEAKSLKVIDMYTLTNNAEYKAQLPDGLHPNEIGHQIIANNILANY